MAEGEGTPAEKTGMILKNVSGFPRPSQDGDINEYTHPEAAAQQQYFSKTRRVVFVNGMRNSAVDHASSALALSFVQMSAVTGVYNKSHGFWKDVFECLADKRQFNGPSTWPNSPLENQKKLAANMVTHEDAIEALSRNRSQVTLFGRLLRSDYRRAEIFAHSQGNLILSNVLQAINLVYGPSRLSGFVVHTFGSPAVNWPAGIVKYEHGFTFDAINWMSGLDASFTISKVGMPKGYINPFTHDFLEYLQNDPEFLINRFRKGMFGETWDMDEQGLADCLLTMGGNLNRVMGIFERLKKRHGSVSDDVAVLYMAGIMANPQLATMLATNHGLCQLLIAILGNGAVLDDERAAIVFLEGLMRRALGAVAG